MKLVRSLIAFILICCRISWANSAIQQGQPLQCQYEVISCYYDLKESRLVNCFTCKLKDVKVIDNLTPTLINTRNNPKTNAEVFQVYFSGGAVKYIPNEIFVEFPAAFVFTVQNQTMDVFDENFLKNAGAQFKQIHFFKSSIKEIKANSFESVQKLELLNFGLNKIEKIHPESFKNLKELLVLGLNENELISVKKLWFQDLQKLTDLFLYKNLIEDIGSDTFSNLINLKTLDLSYNKIRSLDLLAFQGANSLENVDLSHNLINKLPAKTFSSLIKLKELQLKNNLCINLNFENSKDLETEMVRLPCAQN